MHFACLLLLGVTMQVTLNAQVIISDRLGFDAQNSSAIIKMLDHQSTTYEIPARATKFRGSKLIRKPAKINHETFMLEKRGKVIRIKGRDDQIVLLTNEKGDQIHFIQENVHINVKEKFGGFDYYSSANKLVLSSRVIDRRLQFFSDQDFDSPLLWLLAMEKQRQKLFDKDQSTWLAALLSE